ncbi:uncharacterized protein LOC127882314 isoform X2 [Dreissena polymorpha]|uniref:uncharacterized protein LOC127882314 isoform X2 n=1 Tax=Dreissena polymorpha TaxID=45954 RepID=UPI0022647465|nr:uncharacterized protein LOC127882314 isoform X2 [Dreissena polymorpha]
MEILVQYVFCASCCALKSKLELTAVHRGRRSCACQRLIKLNMYSRHKEIGELNPYFATPPINVFCVLNSPPGTFSTTNSSKKEHCDKVEIGLKPKITNTISTTVTTLPLSGKNGTKKNDINGEPRMSPKQCASNTQFSQVTNHMLIPITDGKRKNKNERHSLTNPDAVAYCKETLPRVDYEPGEISRKLSSEIVSDANAYAETGDTDNDDSYENLMHYDKFPTAMKALWESQGRKHNDGKANNSMMVSSIMDKKKRKRTRVPISNVSSIQQNEVVQAINEKDKQELMKQAEREVSHKSAAYARAFDKLKHMWSSKKSKCIACSNPDCQGDFVQSIQGLMHEARKQGLEVNDVPPDGNCMFTAVCDQLQTHNDFSYTASTLREMAVFWLQDHPFLSDDSNTHFQAFMEERWESYLPRMIKDGEWGDHVVLRAVANVTGCTIKILNAHGKTCTWTTLEPSEMPDGRREIMLGLVGESHYTSLRKRDVAVVRVVSQNDDQPTMATEELKLSEEDRALVELFIKDHVDSSSRMPMCSFSFLITRLFSINGVVSEAAEHSFQQLQTWTEIALKNLKDSNCTPMIGGCIGYGIYHPQFCYNSENPSTMFRMIDLNIFYVNKLGDSLDRWGLVGHGTLCSVGYTQLHCSKECVPASTYNTSNCVFTTRNGGQISAVYVVHWPVWPLEANEWISRERHSDWPPEKIVRDICSKGCHLIPEAHVNSLDPDMEWKFCFVDAVTNLFQTALSMNQQYCFLIVFGMCFEVFKHLDVFSLDWLINPFLFSCERCPSEFWQSHPASCVMLIIENMMLCFKSRCLPNYFIPSWNMIEALSEETAKLVMEILGNMRSEPSVVFRQMRENFNLSPETVEAFEKVCQDSQNFENTKSITLNTFIPCMIDIAKRYIKSAQYICALEGINEAFQSRLSVATCEDSMSFENFIQGCFNGLNTFESGWFATFVDKQLQGQLSRPLIRLVLDDREIKRIDEVLEKDIAGFYGSSEVPLSFSYQFDNFCRDYASFLVFVNKMSDALPVLYRCHERYQDYLSGKGDLYFSEETMLEVYAGIFALYKRRHQTVMFKEVIEFASSTVKRVNKPRGYGWLAHVYDKLNDVNGEQTCTAKKEELLRQRATGTDEFSLIHWPMKRVDDNAARGK